MLSVMSLLHYLCCEILFLCIFYSALVIDCADDVPVLNLEFQSHEIFSVFIQQVY